MSEQYWGSVVLFLVIAVTAWIGTYRLAEYWLPKLATLMGVLAGLATMTAFVFWFLAVWA